MKKEIMAQDNGLSELNEFLVPKWEMLDPNGMEKFIVEMIIAKTMRVLPFCGILAEYLWSNFTRATLSV